MAIFRRQETELDTLITKVKFELTITDAETDEFQKLTEVLDRLTQIKDRTEPRTPFDINAALQLLTFLIAIQSVLKHEELNTITSRVWNWLPRLMDTRRHMN